MDTPFVYDNYVTGRNFVGRRTECNSLANLLEAREHVSIYEPPKSGKKSLIQHTLYSMRTVGKQFMAAYVDLFNVRTLRDFLKKFGTAVIRSACSTPEEYADVVSRYLAGSHFVFDAARFASCEEIVCMNWDADAEDIRMMMHLPQRLAEEKEVPFYVIFRDFQNILSAEEHELVFKVMEGMFGDGEAGRLAVFVFSGSMVNAMKFIFEEKRWFYRQVNHLPLSIVDDKDAIEHIVRGFRSSGKVVERDLALGACRLFRTDMWYLNQFFSVCDSLSKGFINEAILVDALNSLLSVHEPRFKAMINDLTDHQLSLLKAILDGVVKFSASDVIEKYRLNSSANVRRVKDALRKKEIMTFNDKEEPVILDPLFEFWVRKYYFEMEVE
ncbi:MAG: ATP-binding protein [Bacteroidales bacterium]|nr:ATP-binding protein [Bacteroidales bacterium]